jgi:hypothetical protein
MKFARFIDNTAVEIFTPPNGFSISDCFHSTVASQYEPVADDVVVGYTKPVVETTTPTVTE